MEHNHQKSGLMNWIVLLLATAVGVFVTGYVNSTAGWLAGSVLALGLLVALASYFQMRLEYREALEKLEFDELNKAKGSAALFTAEADSFPAQRSREQFEKFFVPAFTVILFLFEAAVGFGYWRYLDALAKPVIAERALVGAALFGLIFLVLFMVGKFSARLAQLDKERLLRASAGYLLLGAYVSLAMAATIAMGAWADFPQADRVVGRCLSVIIGLIAVETFVGLLLEVYRPRHRGKKAPRVLYESRLVGLLGQPEGIFKTAAHALDYQFGFKVSETGFYKFIEQHFPKLLLGQLTVLVLSTCFVFIDTGEQALLERFGRPVAGREVLGPGLHLKLPFPVDRAIRYRTEQVQSFVIGAEKEEHDEKTVVWSVAHEKEENMLVASRDSGVVSTNKTDEKKSPPVNLLSVSIPVQYQITNLADWAYNNEDGHTLLTNVAQGEVVRYLVSADFHEIMAQGRGEAANAIRERIQAAANARQLGVNIVFVGLEDTHPPTAVAKDYEAVVAAIQTRYATNLAARSFAIETNAMARADAFRRQRIAEAERQQIEVSAMARAASFTNQLPAYNAAPSVYAKRAYFQAISRGSKDARKYVIASTNTQDVITMNLEDKIGDQFLKGIERAVESPKQ